MPIIPAAYRDAIWWTSQTTPPYRYYCYSGGRASGKSTTIAQTLVLRAAMQPLTILCAREYQNSITDSVHKLLSEQIDALQLPGYTVTRDTITHVNGSQFIFRGLHSNLQSIKSMEGIDVCWVEEAQTITRDSLDVLIPTVRQPESTLFFSWNPLTVSDPVMSYFVTQATSELKAQTLYRHTTYRDVWQLLNPTVKDMIIAAQGTPEFAHVWEGEPYADIANQIISPKGLYAALEQPSEGERVSMGVDVARYGTDRTALCIKKGNRIEELISWRHQSLTASADTISRYIQKLNPYSVQIDDTGVGGGLTDILTRRHGSHVVRGVNFAGRARNPRLYPNIASELWFDFADMLPTLSISRDLSEWPSLVQELTTRTWQINSKNQRQVESKQHWKDRNTLGSPDLADAVLLACYRPAELPSWTVQV